ncbi:MAG: response regulator [Candidatus Omnitrophica bacterium]|nr:response regulator [Candidatus Omnitrophota bacterium]
MHRILVIDDEESLVKNIEDFLKAKGYEVFASLDGNSGIELLKTQNVDLLILDLHLKDGPSGIQILRVAKMVKPDLKVVMFTGFGEEEEARTSCMSLGANAFLCKPTSLKDLTITIEDLLEVK